MRLKNCIIMSLLMMLNLTMAMAQGKTISGNVSDDTGMPLPGANVIIKGTTIGTQSDFDGNYTITANVGDILQFSYVGMKTVEKTVGLSNTINVVMTSSNQLEEVVVMGYGSQSRTELTSSTVQVDAEEIELVPVSTVDQVLQGKVAGLAFSGNSGTPGSTTDIRIRGVSSITAGNEPLYVIDGVPMDNNDMSATSSGSSLSALASINSNNIESITVLKDASATAAYGARGANGVIVITTKSGKDGKTTFNFSATYGFGNDAVEGPTVLTGAEREMLFYESLINTYGAGFGFSDQAGAKAFYEANPGFFGTDYVVWNANGRKETDWAAIVTNEDAPIQEYNISARGGNENHNFYTSFGYFDQEATVIGSQFNRMTGTVNFSQKLNDNMRLSTKNSASHTYQDGLLETSAFFSSPRTVKFFNPSIEPAYNEDGTININTSLPNPLWISKNDIDDSKFTRVISNNSFEWDLPFIDGLKFTSRINIDYQVYNYKRYRNRVSGDGSSTNGSAWQAHQNTVTYVFQNTLDYTWNINDDHSIDFTAVQEFQKNRNYYLDGNGDSFATDGLTNLASAGNPTGAFSFNNDWALGRYVGIMHYSGYNGKYVLDGTFTREGNSRFSPSNRWGNFWSVGAGWNIHKEAFLENSEVINNFKLRGSYGVTGNANIGLNSYQQLFGYGNNYANEGAIHPAAIGNEKLSWETSHTLDFGIDFGLFNNTVSGNFGYYRRESRDLLLAVPLSFITGMPIDPNVNAPSQTRNIGRMENKGFEVELNVNVIRSEDFNVSFGGNVSTTKNEVLELVKDAAGETLPISGGTRQRTDVGHPVWGWHMQKWAGVDPDNGDELYYINGKDGATTNNFNLAQRAFQGGSAIPEITAGMNLHIDYKGFFLDASGYFAGGHKVYEDWHRYTNGTDRFSTQFYQGVDAILDRWQKPGDTGKRFGRFQYAGIPWQSSTKFLYDGDYFRLKNLTFGYDFKSDLLDAVGLDGARVFIRGTNLLTWVKDDRLKYDPEIDSNGLTTLTTPPIKSFIFGINAKF